MRLNDIYPAVLTIVLIGIILGIGLYVLSELEDQMYNSASVSKTREDGCYVNDTGFTVSNASLGLTDFSLDTVVIYNVTKVLTSGNYTFTSAGVITNATAAVGWLPSYLWTINYTYSYNVDTDATDAVNETIAGLGDFAGWIAVIVVVIAAAIVLGIVLSNFGGRRPGI